MKGLFLVAVPALLLTVPAVAELDPKTAAQCKDARDFVGCVKAFTTPAAPSTDSLTALRNAMKQVASRLRAGTSLRDSTSTFQPVVDQLALVESSNPQDLAVVSARKASDLFNVLQTAWGVRIRATQTVYGEKFYNCKILKLSANAFNSIAGSDSFSWNYKKGLFGIDLCKVGYGQLPEDYMRPIVVRVLTEGSISPEEIAAREKAEEERTAKLKREQELCALGPWNRYLEENPNMKTWVSANPKAAAKAKEKYINDPNNKTDCRVGLERIYDSGGMSSSLFIAP